MRIYYWIDHTGRYSGNSGVQRVTRNLALALHQAGHVLIPVRWSGAHEAIVRAESEWLKGLASFDGPTIPVPPEAGTPIHLTDSDAAPLSGSWLLLPEVASVAGDDAPSVSVVFDYARFYDLRSAAIFYDLIPLRQPGYEDLRDAHERYVRALVAADLIVPISEHAADDLCRWWREHDYEQSRLPSLTAIPLADEIAGIPRTTDPKADDSSVRFVSLGTLEPRKNQVAMMRAFRRLRGRRPDLDLRLDLIGSIHEAVHQEASELAEADERITIHGYIPDDAMRSLVAASHATVFVSLYEGFGLPVAESLWLGKPCICSDHGAVAEIAAGGGCLRICATDERAIEVALEQFAVDTELRNQLTEEASTRPLRSWGEYAERVVDALQTAPHLRRLVIIDGTCGRTRDVGAATATAHRLHWDSSARALLPGIADAVDARPSFSDLLDGAWAIFSAKTAADLDEAREIVASAKALGLRVALYADRSTPPALLADADAALIGTPAERDAALAEALRTLPRTVGIRDKLLVAGGIDAASILRGHGVRLATAEAPRRLDRIYYWAGLTASQPFNTGIQRVARRLAASLQDAGIEVVPVKWDAVTSSMAPLTLDEATHLAQWSGPRTTPAALPRDLDGEWLLVAEVAIPVVPQGSNIARMAHELGMRVAAVFIDLIPAKMPEVYPAGALRAMEEYWRTFSDVDVALPISWSVSADLRRWLEAQELRVPRIVPCPLAGNSSNTPRVLAPARAPKAEEPLRLLAVGTFEPRKNYPRLLRALEMAKQRTTRPIDLTIVGRRAGFDALDREIGKLARTAGAELRGHLADDEVRELHDEAHATVFASYEEGFGLPVLESIWLGRPCVCHTGSAMAELSPGGGVLAVDMLDEDAIADALVGLAEDPKLLSRLADEAVARPIRTWHDYASNVVRAIAHSGSPPGWSLPAVVRRRPLLTCAITTYNRAPWLRHSLARLLEATRPWRDVVEVVVCDNASTDDTPDVVGAFRREKNFASFRNPENVGMLGNLGVTARASSGAFVWLLGDDDLLIDGALENVLEGLAAHPDVEMAYMNYAYTSFDDPRQLDDPERLIRSCLPIADGGRNRYVTQLAEVAATNENLFTAIYTCAFRRDHALRAYQLDTRGLPFTSLRTCVPSSVYALAALQDRPAWWVGDPAVVVNMNVSWLRWALLWHLERMPDLFEEAELRGVDGDSLDRYRLQHLVEAQQWVRTVYFEAEDAIRMNFSLARLLERSKHLREFRDRELPGIRRAYADAWKAGRVAVDPIAPEDLFARYGLADDGAR